MFLSRTSGLQEPCRRAPWAVLVLLTTSFFCVRASAYIEAPMTLGHVVNQSTNIVVLKLEKVEEGENVLHFRKVRDLKGRHDEETVVQRIGQQGFHEREWQTVMRWARPGKIAVLFHNRRSSETCIDNYWYQCNPRGRDWRMTHAEPFLRRSYAGSTRRLIQIVEKVHAGKEAIAPCYVDGEREEIQLGTARVQRLKVSLERLDYNPERDFVGWGGGELEELRGMPGFSHLATLTQAGAHARGVTSGDFDGDGKVDVVLFGERKVALLRNEGKSYGEVELPQQGGARSAAWADFDGDYRLDLLLATARGLRILSSSSDPGAPFSDAADRLPASAAASATSAAWIDANRDGWPDVFAACGFSGLRLFLNIESGSGGREFRLAETVAMPDDVFRGKGVSRRGATLAVADIDGDGWTDVFHDAGTGVLLRGRARGPSGSWFGLEADCGITLEMDSRGGTFGDFDSDGDLDYFSPTGRFGRLFVNDGAGSFHDATNRAFGVVSAKRGFASAASWGDLDADGELDLVVSYRGAPNRVFRQIRGRFVDSTRALGLDRRSFESTGACLADFDADGDTDLAFVNEGSDSCILLSANRVDSEKTAVDVVLPTSPRSIGAVVRISALDLAGGGSGLAYLGELGSLTGSGSQDVSRVHVGLAPGVYRLDVEYRDGARQRENFEVKRSHLVLEVER